MRQQWIKEAIEKCPGDARSYVDRGEEAFWNQEPKTGSWWDELLVQKTGECVNAIVPHPVSERFIKNHKAWSTGDAGNAPPLSRRDMQTL